MIGGFGWRMSERSTDECARALTCLRRSGSCTQVDVATCSAAWHAIACSDGAPAIRVAEAGAAHAGRAEANKRPDSVLCVSRSHCPLDESERFDAEQARVSDALAEPAAPDVARRNGDIQSNRKSMSITGPTTGPIGPFLVGPVLTSLRVAAGFPGARLSPVLRAALARYPTRDCRRDPCNVSLRCFAPARWR